MLDLYEEQVRSIMEYASSVWGSMLTDDLESVQIAALAIIYSNCSFEESLKINKIKTKNKKTENMIPLNENNDRLRHKEKYKVPLARKQRLFKSTIPTMARMLNSKHISITCLHSELSH